MDLQFTDSFLPQRVTFGAGGLDGIGLLLQEEGVRRPLICTSGAYRRNGTVGRLAAFTGSDGVVVFDAVQPHVPEEAVLAVLDIARKSPVDGIVSLGGGSTVGTAKAVCARLLDGGEFDHIPIVAIPTTYAGSEMTPVYGVTLDGRKTTKKDVRVLPSVVIYDPDLTVDLPADITAATAANALAHCVEGVYSKGRTPLATSAALSAISLIASSLLQAVRDGYDRDARGRLLLAAYLAGVTIAHAGMALHHAMCHALGAEGVPHGVANAIMLAHVMRFNLPAAVDELAAVAGAVLASEPSEQPARPASLIRASNRSDIAALAISRVESLLFSLPVPHRLRDTVVDPAAFPRISNAAMHSSATALNPRVVEDLSQLVTILEEAW